MGISLLLVKMRENPHQWSWGLTTFMLGDQYYKYMTVIEKYMGHSPYILIYIDGLHESVPFWYLCRAIYFDLHLLQSAMPALHWPPLQVPRGPKVLAPGCHFWVPPWGLCPGKGSKWLVRLWIITTRWSKWNWKSQYSGVMLPLLSWCGKAVPSSLTWLWGGMCFNRLQQSKWIT